MKYTINNNATSNTIILFANECDAEHYLDFDGKPESITVVYDNKDDLYLDTITTIVVGVGELHTEQDFKDATKLAVSKAMELERTNISIKIPNIMLCGNIAEEAFRSTYIFSKKLKPKTCSVKEIEFYGNVNERHINLAYNMSDSVAFCRDLQNGNASLVTPAYLSLKAKQIALDFDNMHTRVIENRELIEEGLNLIHAVGKGSNNKPALIVIEYIGNPSSPHYHTALIGKGVTFDSGGLSLKPSKSMETMRMDMSGASTVLGFMTLVGKEQPNINILVVIPTAENAIDGNSYHIGDVIESYDGKTVEILNTDAEGRLILADAIAYTSKNYQPNTIIDFATLTGAMVSALGTTIAGIFSNSDLFAEEIYDAGEISGERVWQMPIRKEHRDDMKSDVADLRNISKGKGAGSITAAAFLEEFVGEDIDWCHIDIAGVADDDTGGLGWGIRLLAEYFRM